VENVKSTKDQHLGATSPYSYLILCISIPFTHSYLFLTLIPIAPCRLEELFLCLNEYDQVAESPVPCPSLRLLQITDNQLQEWDEVRKFGPMYPGLQNLVLSNNKLGSVEEDTPQDTLQRLFPNLRSINLNNSGIRREGHACTHIHKHAHTA
jgi:hypothetical protein